MFKFSLSKIVAMIVVTLTTLVAAQGASALIAPSCPNGICSPQANSCANVRCGSGTQCIETNSGPQCQPVQTTTCANVRCGSGTQCVETNSGPQCINQTNDACPRGTVYSPHKQKCIWKIKKLKKKLKKYFNQHGYGQHGYNNHDQHQQYYAPTYIVPSYSAPSYYVPTYQAPTYYVPNYQVPTYYLPSYTSPSYQVW